MKNITDVTPKNVVNKKRIEVKQNAVNYISGISS